MTETRHRTTIRAEETALGKVLAEKRKEAGMSQIEVSRRVDITRSRLAQIETGGTRLNVTDMFLLCECYGLDVEIIVGAARLRARRGQA